MTHRNTRQRRLLLECLEASREHLTADTLTELARESDPTLGRATVYRYLRRFREEGLVQRYVLPDGAGACYRYIGEHSSCRSHYHLKCSVCGDLMHIETELLDNFALEVLKKSGFEIDEGETVFYGKCKSCKENEVSSDV